MNLLALTFLSTSLLPHLLLCIRSRVSLSKSPETLNEIRNKFFSLFLLTSDIEACEGLEVSDGVGEDPALVVVELLLGNVSELLQVDPGPLSLS